MAGTHAVGMGERQQIQAGKRVILARAVGKIRKNIRKNCVTMRTARPWNGVPRGVVLSLSTL